IDQVFGILSFSMTADNLLLWAHYASEHRGLAVEIDPRDREFNRHTSRDQNFERAGRVRYSAERPHIPETDEIFFDHFFVKVQNGHTSRSTELSANLSRPSKRLM